MQSADVAEIRSAGPGKGVAGCGASPWPSWLLFCLLRWSKRARFEPHCLSRRRQDPSPALLSGSPCPVHSINLAKVSSSPAPQQCTAVPYSPTSPALHKFCRSRAGRGSLQPAGGRYPYSATRLTRARRGVEGLRRGMSQQGGPWHTVTAFFGNLGAVLPELQQNAARTADGIGAALQDRRQGLAGCFNSRQCCSALRGQSAYSAC